MKTKAKAKVKKMEIAEILTSNKFNDNNNNNQKQTSHTLTTTMTQPPEQTRSTQNQNLLNTQRIRLAKINKNKKQNQLSTNLIYLALFLIFSSNLQQSNCLKIEPNGSIRRIKADRDSFELRCSHDETQNNQKHSLTWYKMPVGSNDQASRQKVDEKYIMSYASNYTDTVKSSLILQISDVDAETHQGSYICEVSYSEVKVNESDSKISMMQNITIYEPLVMGGVVVFLY